MSSGPRNEILPRRNSIELNSISKGRESLPPPSGVSMREWFAGLALGNPELMRGIPNEKRGAEAVRLADEMMRALKAKSPTIDSMKAPAPEQMKAWDVTTSRAKEARRDTVPVRGRNKRNIIPPPSGPLAVVLTRSNALATMPPPPPRAKKQPDAGAYSHITNADRE